jgi:hypothetical protein
MWVGCFIRVRVVFVFVGTIPGGCVVKLLPRFLRQLVQMSCMGLAFISN